MKAPIVADAGRLIALARVGWWSRGESLTWKMGQKVVEERALPAISMFYGLIVYMYFLDNRQHHMPHIHVRYQDQEVVVAIENGDVLEGSIPAGKMKLLQAWIELHRDELMANWQLAINGQHPYKIDPLR